MKDWTGNYNSIYKVIGATNHASGERETNDYYATDGIAIDKLLTKEKPQQNIWECAVGGGDLSNRLKENGYTVIGSDIIQRGGVDFISDFLQADKLPFDRCDILTNPPYKYAKEFVLKALDLLHDGDKCFMFLKLTFLEGKSRFHEIFSHKPPIKVLVFSERVLCAKNAEFEKMRANGGSAVAYAWFVWQKGNYGKTEIEWL